MGISTTLQGDWTKAEIMAQDLKKQTSNRQLSIRERKVIQTSDDYTPAVSGDWAVAPTKQDEAIDALAAAIYPAGAEPGAIVAVTLSVSQLKALNTTPITLVAAPAAGKYIVVEAIEMLTTGTVGYDGVATGEDLTVQYGTAGDTIATAETTGWLDSATAAGRLIVPAVSTAIAPPTAQAVSIKNSGAIFAAAGNHGLKVSVRYRVVTALV